QNPDANGNAWFVGQLIPVGNSNQEIMALDSLDLKNKAVFNRSKFANLKGGEFKTDSTASIILINYTPNHLTYRSENTNPGVAVFSEMYYPNGWNAYIDGQLKEHFRVDYVLRGLVVPEGKHTIEFKFQPEIIQYGAKITLASSMILMVVFIVGLGYSIRNSRKKTAD